MASCEIEFKMSSCAKISTLCPTPGKILNWALRTFDTIQIVKKDVPFTNADLWLGKKDKIDVVTKEDIYLTIPKRKKKTIKAYFEYNGLIQAPVSKGDKVGVLSVYVSGEIKKTIDVFASEDVKKTNIFSRLFRSFNYLVWGDV